MEGGTAADVDVEDGASVAYGDVVSDAASRGDILGDVVGRELLQTLRELGAVAIEGHHVGQLRCELLVDGYLTSASLVHDSCLGTIAKAALTLGDDTLDPGDETMVANVVVGNAAFHILNETAIAHRDVVEGYAKDARLANDASGKCESALERTNLHMAGETYTPHALGGKIGGYEDVIPILCGAYLLA